MPLNGGAGPRGSWMKGHQRLEGGQVSRGRRQRWGPRRGALGPEAARRGLARENLSWDREVGLAPQALPEATRSQ